MLDDVTIKPIQKGKMMKLILIVSICNLALLCIYVGYAENFTLPNYFSVSHKLQSFPIIATFDKQIVTQDTHNNIIDNYTSRIDMNWLVNNSVYKQFRIKPLPIKKRVTVLVIVSSGPRRIDRRNAIRQTWWQMCKPTEKVTPECIFMTDHSPKGSKNYNITHGEVQRYGDVRFQHVPSGITFGLRMLNHMVFAVSNYKFDYFLRMDDDYFMCFQNFLDEIPLPPLNRFHWGWIHRQVPVVRPEESMLLLSHDLIEEFLLQDSNKIMCHPWADQMIAEWSNTIDLRNVWRHDERLWHTPPARDNKAVQSEKDICHKYIALHGAYPKHMYMFWNHTGEFEKRGGDLRNYTTVVGLNGKFNWRVFTWIWQYEPKPCIEDYNWNTSKQSVTGGSYTGRQGSQK